MNIKSVLSIAFLFCIAASSCTDEAALKNIEAPKGRWIIASALQDGEPTKALDMAYIRFVDSTRWASNLLTNDDTVRYTIDGARLISADQDVVLSVVYQSEDSLVLQTQVAGNRYEMLYIPSEDSLATSD